MNLTDLVFEVDTSINKTATKKISNELPKDTLRLIMEPLGIQLSEDLLKHLKLNNNKNNYISIVTDSRVFDNIKNEYLFNISVIMLTTDTSVLKQNKYHISKAGIIRSETLHNIFLDYMYDQFIEGTDFLVQKVYIAIPNNKEQFVNAINLSLND